MAIHTLEELAACAGDPFELVLDSDCVDRAVTAEESLSRMNMLWRAMLASAQGYDPCLRSGSGMVGGEGDKMARYIRTEHPLLGGFAGEVITLALQMGECNACMKRIVAAPTAGSCGVMPAVLIPYQKRNHLPDEAMVRALYVAGAIGQVIAEKASIAGAQGGCQAEIGTAAAMAAGAVVYLEGGSSRDIIHAAALAIKSLMGLVCDPIAGLVEVPCVKRNASGAMIALTAAQMALSGIRSAVPPDEVLTAMKEVGDKMDVSLRETGLGGVAGTKFGMKIAEEMEKR